MTSMGEMQSGGDGGTPAAPAPNARRSSRRATGRAARLRRWLLAGSVLLLASIVGFIGYARYRIRQAKLDLPRLLGADIRSETDGFTWSQSVKGRTLFTIHAAKAIQHKDGKTMLRNVAVTVYGEPGSDRVDRIHGSEFEYDQTGGIVRALGESEIDLASPAAAGTAADAKRIHVTANGLVFDQKKGAATADGPIHFAYGAVQGSATGADFDAHTGVLMLHHDVHVVDTGGHERQQVDAASAELDRESRVARLHEATLAQAGQVLRAREMVVRLRPNNGADGGSIESVDGSDGVELRAADGATATAPVLQASLTGQNRLRTATLTGGVAFHAAEQDGNAGEATLSFNGAGQASHVRLVQAVTLRQSGVDGRELTADTVDAELAADATGHTALQDSVATGHATLRLQTPATGAKPQEVTTVRADVLHAFGDSRSGKWQVRRLTGEGGTRMEQLLGTGEARTSSGQHLDISFATGQDRTDVASFVQQGSVHMVDSRPATGSRDASQSVADGQRADYQGSTETIVLTGEPVVRNAATEVEATSISVLRATGDAEATGAVKGSGFAGASGRGAKSSDPLHFSAERAVTNRAARQVTLFGGQRPARLWNGTSQIEAPVIEVDEGRGVLLAHAAAGDQTTAAVRAVLPAAANGDERAAGGSDTVRVLSRTLRYAQATNAAPAFAEFAGSVRMDSASGRVLADLATVTLGAAVRKAGATDGGLLGGSVDHVTADGQVRVQQPGRMATGARLVYTAAMRQFVLTGAPGVPPTVRDSVQGTVTGTSLLFRAGDDSVEVAGSSGEPVRTEIDAPPRQTAKQGRTARSSSSGKAGEQK